jgi:hypothetical protein
VFVYVSMCCSPATLRYSVSDKWLYSSEGMAYVSLSLRDHWEMGAADFAKTSEIFIDQHDDVCFLKASHVRY